MKKLLSVILALVMILSLSTVAFADEGDTADVTRSDATIATLKKVYKLANAGTVNPEETFTFDSLEFVSATDTGVEYDATNVPMPKLGSVKYEKGTVTTDGLVASIEIELPSYTAVGIYTYKFKEHNNKVAGVTYHDKDIKLVVTVIQDGNLKRVAAIHTEEEGQSKSGVFENLYSAGSLSVTKKVTGNMGDKKKEFEVDVTFKAPTGKIVTSDITYTDGTENKTIAGDWDTEKTVKITLKDGETVTFDNIPYDVTYEVVEHDYTTEANGKYDPADYEYSEEGKIINSAAETVTIINNKGVDVDTGIALDSLPYVLLLAVACVGMAVVLTKKRRED